MSALRLESAAAILDKLLAAGLGFAVAVALARALGVDDLGDFALYTAVATITATFANFGVHSVTGRAIAQNPSRLARYMGNALAIRLYISTPAALLMTGASPLVLDRGVDQVGTALLCAANVQALSVVLLLCNAFFSLRRVPSALTVNIVQKAVALVLAIPVAFLSHSLHLTLLGLIVSACAGSILGFRLLQRSEPAFRIALRPRFAQALIRRSMPLASAAIAENIGLRIDVVLVGAMLGSTAAGNYGASYSLYMAGTMAPLALVKVFFVRYAAAIGKDPQVARSIVTQAWWRLVLLSCATACLLGPTAFWIVPTIFGKEFHASVTPLLILSVALPFISVNRLYGHMLVAHGADGAYFRSVVLSAVVNIALNCLLIPICGIVGAAFSTIATECATLIYARVALARIVRTI